VTLEILIVLAVLLVAVVLFATEKLPVDLVAVMVMAVLLVTRIVSVEEGIRGFANPATVTVGAMFILSAGLTKTGAVDGLGRWLSALGSRSAPVAILAMMIGIGIASAFINNTATVAIFLPVLLTSSRWMNTSPSKLLIPLSFASMFGGTCTLLGSSTNILTSSVAEAHGLPALRMFEFMPLGLIFFAVGTAYMATIGVRLLPARRAPGDLTAGFELSDYLTEIELLPGAASIGSPLAASPLVRDLDVAVLAISRAAERIPLPKGDVVLQAGDILSVSCAADKLRGLTQREGIAVRTHVPWGRQTLGSDRMVLVEAILAPNSDYKDLTLASEEFRRTLRGAVLAIRHQGQVLRDELRRTPLRSGDAVLLDIDREELPLLRRDRNFVLVSEIGGPRVRTRRVIPALAIIAGVVGVAASGTLPIVATAIAGCVLMVLAGCTTLEDAYRSIEWKVIFLLAGVLTLGEALETTGATRLLANELLSAVGSWGPTAVISAFYLLTSLLTEAMSNNATAALMAPIAIAAAHSMGCDPRPFIMAVAFAASSSFMTPVGYQTNTLVYGPGGYRFFDFTRVGAPLNLLFWILATVFIPRFWPF